VGDRPSSINLPHAALELVGEVSWRWVFYVNVPLGIVAAIVLPSPTIERKARIDYLGATLLTAAVTCIVGTARERGVGDQLRPRCYR
jgi:MFS family permease